MILLIAAVAVSTYFVLKAEYVYTVLSFILVLVLLQNLRRSYNQFNKNIIFLLNALDNGDYSFNFSETKLSRREKELNQMMNRIKDILSKARKEVIENEEFLGVIMESVSTGIIILNDFNQVVNMNRSANQLLGMPVFTHLNQLGHIDKSFPALFRNLDPSDSKTIRIANEREEVQLSLRASEIVMKRGKMKIITLNNIGSELDYKEMDSWIRLIRVMTHEIMNSIAPVTSLTDTLLSAFRQDDHKDENNDLMQNTVEALQTINSTAKGLTGFVNSYRQFTGIPKPQLNPVPLQSVIERAVALETVLFEEKKIKATLHIFPQERGAPPYGFRKGGSGTSRSQSPETMIPLDESQIMQVLLNLLKNAVEAAPEVGGEIRVDLSEAQEKIHLDVCNNGQPIAGEVLPNIFVPFFTTRQSGTGIGLSVSRYIMRLHGGTLTHFTKDEWTIFRMTFYRAGK